MSSFFIAFFLQVLPCPEELFIFQPNWIFLILLYWILLLPCHINIGTSFAIGIALDLISGATLGVHALAFSIVSYIVTYNFKFLHKLPFYQQSLLVILLSLIKDLIIFVAEFLVIYASFRPELFWSNVVDGVLWPWLFWLMRKID